MLLVMVGEGYLKRLPGCPAGCVWGERRRGGGVGGYIGLGCAGSLSLCVRAALSCGDSLLSGYNVSVTDSAAFQLEFPPRALDTPRSKGARALHTGGRGRPAMTSPRASFPPTPALPHRPPGVVVLPVYSMQGTFYLSFVSVRTMKFRLAAAQQNM